MNKTLKRILTWFVLPVIIVVLVVLIVNSIMQPVKFNKETEARKVVAVQRLKDIRTLQVAFKGVNNRFSPTVDSLIDFYNNGQMIVVMQIGSADDSLAMAHTQKVKAANRKITAQELYRMYEQGDKNLVFSIENKIPVKESVFTDRTDFCVDSLKYIPFSGGDEVIMESAMKMVSGVNVPLFEAKMPYKSLLKGLNNQLRINLDAQQKDMNRYEGLQVGSISAPNNNAGNWE